jgi:hypothetical protein
MRCGADDFENHGNGENTVSTSARDLVHGLQEEQHEHEQGKVRETARAKSGDKQETRRRNGIIKAAR